MPRHAADLYDYLATSKVSEVTVAQLEQSLENSFINKSNIEFWKGAITVQRLMEVSRTYPHGLPIPEASTVATISIDPLGEGYIQPTGTEVWEIMHIRAAGMGGSATATISWTDGATDSEVNVAASIPAAGTNVELNGSISGSRPVTITGYIKVRETAGNFGIQLIVAYHKLSL